MDNPLEQPAPLDPLERVQAFARDLAWGVLNRDWSARLSVVAYAAGGSEFWQHNPKGHDSFVQYIETKWQNEVPDLELLRALGYMHLEPVKEDSNSRVFILSQSAFQLLEKPLAPPSVFISYQRATSSALGLLVVARLKAVGVPNPFIDMNIEGGDAWQQRIESSIRGSRYFILLLAPGTLDKEWVRYEIKIAQEVPGMTLIPIWHNGYRGEGMEAAGLSARNAIRIVEEHTDQYELAMIKLLNALGYGP